LSYPGAPELCGDFADNDCNGLADDRDFDLDGWVAVQCGGEDCNDNSDVASPNGVEVCGDSTDNDCDGSVDNKDGDFDGFIDRLCGGPDCNDARGDVKPGAPELCGGGRNNGNRQIDEKGGDADGHKDDDEPASAQAQHPAPIERSMCVRHGMDAMLVGDASDR